MSLPYLVGCAITILKKYESQWEGLSMIIPYMKGKKTIIIHDYPMIIPYMKWNIKHV